MTTRPLRPGEKDYKQVSVEEFEYMIEHKMLMEYTTFTKADEGVVYYGSLIDDYADSDDKFVILNPKSLKQIHGLNSLITFYIDVPSTVIYHRLYQRGDGHDKKEIIRRMNADDIDFLGVEKYVQFKILYNNSLNPNYVASYIDERYWECMKKQSI